MQKNDRYLYLPTILSLVIGKTFAIHDPFVNVSTPFRESIRNKYVGTEVRILSLDFQWEYMSEKMKGYEQLTGAKIIKQNTSTANWFDDIAEDINGAGLIDLYSIFGNWVPTFVEEGGLIDITDNIADQVGLDWFDIMPAVRRGVASYKEKVYSLPVDGDVIIMLYRTDLVEDKGLPAPNTWDDVMEITNYYANKDFTGDGIPDYANCFPTAENDVSDKIFWAVASTFLQTKGTSGGTFFDPDTFEPVSDDPRFLSILEFYNSIVQESPYRDKGPITWLESLDVFREGRCVLWYNYPGPTRVLISEQEENNMTGILNYATMPGMKCKDRLECPFMTDGNANHSPFLASGGMAFALSSRSAPERQDAALAFAFYISDPATGYWDVAYPGSYLDPLRQRHTVALSNPESAEAKAFLNFGWEERQLAMLKNVTEFNFLHENYVKDLRIYGANEYQQSGTRHVLHFLSKKITAQEAAESMTIAWNAITEKYGLREQRAMYRETIGLPPYADKNENLINKVRPVGWALACVIIVASLSFSGWIMVNKKRRIVRASQPTFLVMICFGTLILGSAIFPLGIDNSIASQRSCDIACMSSPWLVFCGFTIAFSALFSKIWRINKIFLRARFTRIKVSEKDVLVPFMIMLSLNVLLLTLWTIIDPLKWNRFFIDDLNSYGACKSTGNAWIAFVVSLGVVNFSALVLACSQAYRARGISDEFSESKYVALAMGSIFQTSVIALPLLVLVQENPPARFFVYTGLIFVVCMSLLFLIFIPKIMHKKTQTHGQNSFGEEGIRIKASPMLLDAALKEISEYKNVAEENQHKLESLRIRVLEKDDIDLGPLITELGFFVTKGSIVDQSNHANQEGKLTVSTVDKSTGTSTVDKSTGTSTVDKSTGTSTVDKSTGASIVDKSTATDQA